MSTNHRRYQVSVDTKLGKAGMEKIRWRGFWGSQRLEHRFLFGISAIMTDPTKIKNSTEHIGTISVNKGPLKPQYKELDKLGAALPTLWLM
ncbi:hypothetical protein N0V86_007415 [Didymella sp. IMI 355093]|nr:hypothetical protein N0V86_007415 [Didymella sp. IMI 355093]